MLDCVPGWQPNSPPGFPNVLIVANVAGEDGVPGVLGDGEARWHTDMSYLEQPPVASVLHSLEIPPAGGDTCFMSMTAVLERMPPGLRQEWGGRLLNHDSSHDSSGQLRPGQTRFADVSEAPGARHEAVRVHPETKRPSLFLGRRLHAHVVGESVAKSEALLDSTWAFCESKREQAKLTYRHRWEVGDLLMWDNRCTMHRRDPFDSAARRVMHRTQIKEFS